MSIPKTQEASTLKNKIGLTATDIADGISKDMNSLEIQIILMSKKERNIIIAPTSGDEDAAAEQTNTWMNKWHWRKMHKCVDKWCKLTSEWLIDMRGNLGTVSTVISTMTFQALINPPGSFIQQSINPSNPLECLDMENSFGCPGDSLLVSRGSADDFRQFIYYNTVAFAASMGVTLLLISGLPLKNRFVMLIFSMAMCLTLSALARAYFIVMYMIIPSQMWDTVGDQILNAVSKTWQALIVVVSGYIILAFLFWFLKHCIRFLTKRIALMLSPHMHSSPASRLPLP